MLLQPQVWEQSLFLFTVVLFSYLQSENKKFQIFFWASDPIMNVGKMTHL